MYARLSARVGRLSRLEVGALIVAAVAVLWMVTGASERRGAAGLVAGIGLLTAALARLANAKQQTELAMAQVDLMVRSSPVGMAFVDRRLRFVEVNETLARLNGRSVVEHLGRRIDEMDGFRETELAELAAEVLRTGHARLDVPLSRRDVRVAAGCYPVRAPDGAIDGVGIVVREVTVEHQRDVLLDRVTRLQELASSLASTGTVDEVVDAAIDLLLPATSARAAAFCVKEGEDVVIKGSIGYDEQTVAQTSTFRVTEDLPVAVAVSTARTVTASNREEALERWPNLDTSSVWGDAMSLAAVPMRGESGVIGAIGLRFDEEHDFDGEQIAFLVAVATHCATAYERAIAFEAERAARRDAEAASQRLLYLVEATTVLSQSLDPEATMQRLAELAVPAIADWCAVHLVRGDVAVPVAIASENPEATAMVRALSERHPVPIDAPAGLGAVVRTGEPVVMRSVTQDAVEASTSEAEVVDLLSRLRSIAIVPMMFQGKVLGTVTLSNVTDRRLGSAEVDLARELAARAAQAVSNAQLFQDRTRVASTLQASLMPTSPTLIPGVDVATRFVPAAEGLDVGGDFYDVFRLGTLEEPAPTWALVIGDVRGKGADAAAITGIARATIRATALDETSPSVMLARLNQVLLAASRDDTYSSETGEPRFCTVCVAAITPTAAGADIVLAVGGHPLPYVVRSSGAVEQVGNHGGLIGVMSTPGITDAKVHMDPGDSFVLYTDGVTEQHAGRTFFDEEELGRVLSGCSTRTATEIAERIEQSARAFVDGGLKDDLAVVVARIAPTSATGTVSRSELPADDRAAALARRFVSETLEGLGVELPETAVLLASELVTNALLHGAPPLHIEVLATPEGVRVAVTDGHPDLPTLRVAGQEDEHGRGLLLVEALAARWGVDANPPGKSVWFELEL